MGNRENRPGGNESRWSTDRLPAYVVSQLALADELGVPAGTLDPALAHYDEQAAPVELPDSAEPGRTIE